MSLAGRAAFHDLRVARIVQETADTRSFVLDVPPPLRELFRYEAGHFLTFQVCIDDATLNRCYSLSSAPDCDADLHFTVKRVADGRVSQWFHDHVIEGDVLRVHPPTGGFVLRPRSERPLVLFSGGSGITPVLSLLKTVLATTVRRAKLVYANRDAASIIFRDALSALAARHPDRLALVHHLDVESGFLDAARVQREITGLEDAEFYLCGPVPFMDLVERVLRESGIPDDRILIERFEFAAPADAGAAEAPSAGASDAPATITVHLDGVAHEIPYVAGDTLLQSARKAGLNPPSACEDGYCGCCMATLLRGDVAMAQCHALDDDDRARCMILTCQARPTSGAVEVRWD